MCSALASDSPLTYQRRGKGSVVDAVEPQVREMRRAPTMPATVIAERIGWQHGSTVLRVSSGWTWHGSALGTSSSVVIET